MQLNRTPTVVVKLTLSDETQQTLQLLIKRTHTGRWPLWRSLGMRQVGELIFEAVQWRPQRRDDRPEYSLLRWDITGLGVSWQDQPSRRAVIAALAGAVRRPAPELALAKNR